MDLRLRDATAADVPRIEALVQAAYGHYVERIGGPPRPLTDDYAQVVREGATVAERDGAIAGLVVLRTDDEGFWIDNVAVDPAHQGTGVGRALLEHGEARARAAGFDAVHFVTHETMTENLALYARIGYAELERRPVDRGAIVVMRKPLS